MRVSASSVINNAADTQPMAATTARRIGSSEDIGIRYGRAVAAGGPRQWNTEAEYTSAFRTGRCSDRDGTAGVRRHLGGRTAVGRVADRLAIPGCRTVAGSHDLCGGRRRLPPTPGAILQTRGCDLAGVRPLQWTLSVSRRHGVAWARDSRPLVA